MIDLSSGGALLELPFQAVPQSRLVVELHTSVERLMVPIHLLRCYVVKLKGGVRYHAAGVFDQLLTLPSAVPEVPSSSSVERLVSALERLRRVRHEGGHSRGAQFHELLTLAVAGLRRGECVTLVTLKLKSRLTHRYPSLTIGPSQPFYRAALTSAQFFGLTFRSRTALSAADRRFLRSSAQLLSLLEACDRKTQSEMEVRYEQEPSAAVYSAAEWLASTSPHAPDLHAF